MPDTRTGEEVCAWVRCKPDWQPSPKELTEFCKERVTKITCKNQCKKNLFLNKYDRRIWDTYLDNLILSFQLSYFKVPRYFLFKDSFPLTVTGKVQKFVMREITVKELGL